MIVKLRKARRSKKVRNCNAPNCGFPILEGEEYYSWSFRYGGRYFRHASCGYPPRSVLTQSKLGDVYAAQERAQAALQDTRNSGEIVAAQDEIYNILQEVAQEAERVSEEYREAAEQFGGMGDNAERADALESYASELSSWSPTVETPESEECAGIDPEVIEQYLSEICQEAQDALDSLEL